MPTASPFPNLLPDERIPPSLPFVKQLHHPPLLSLVLKRKSFGHRILVQTPKLCQVQPALFAPQLRLFWKEIRKRATPRLRWCAAIFARARVNDLIPALQAS